MFELDLIEFPTLNRVDGADRTYETPGGSYPSVTTVLDKTKDKTHLIAWQERVGDEEAKRIKDQAASRGTGMHELCEKLVLNEKVNLREHMPLPVFLYKQIEPILKERVGKVRGVESQMYSDYLKVAGTTDLIAEFDGKLSIIDYKTSIKPKREEWIDDYFIQTAIYAICFEERTGIPINQLVVLIANEESASPSMFISTRKKWQKIACERIEAFHRLP
jgi:genome maintenance exonuclease 1